MISHQDVCAQCGEAHPDTMFGLRHAAGRGCPNVLMGAFPVLTRREPTLAGAAVHRAMDAERSLNAFGQAPAAGDHSFFARKPARSAIPWPLPSDVEEFL